MKRSVPGIRGEDYKQYIGERGCLFYGRGAREREREIEEREGEREVRERERERETGEKR